MSAYTDADVQATKDALIAEGAAPGSDIHSWRCEYPDMYGPCDCVGETARAVLDAVAPAIAARALRESAGAASAALTNGVSGHTSTYSVRRWLHERADEIERGTP